MAGVVYVPESGNAGYAISLEQSRQLTRRLGQDALAQALNTNAGLGRGLFFLDSSP